MKTLANRHAWLTQKNQGTRRLRGRFLVADVRDAEVDLGSKAPLTEVWLCEGFRMPPHGDGAAQTGAGVRKPPREETAGDLAKQRVRRYGDFGAGGLLPRCVDHLVEKRSTGWRARSAGRGS